MNRFLTRWVVAGLVGVVLGCATQSFEVKGPVGPAPEAALETSPTFFVGGVGQSAQNVARVETELSVIDGLLASLTGDIYAPCRHTCTAFSEAIPPTARV